MNRVVGGIILLVICILMLSTLVDAAELEDTTCVALSNISQPLPLLFFCTLA